MAKQIFVNLPVKDLKKTVKFFSKLGFKFNSKFTDDKAACMILGKDMYSMLLLEKFFKSFIKKEIADSKKNTEVLVALSVDSKKEVDNMIKKVMDSGGKEARDPEDYGWMYARAFEDLDGHIWEIFYADESKRKNN